LRILSWKNKFLSLFRILFRSSFSANGIEEAIADPTRGSTIENRKVRRLAEGFLRVRALRLGSDSPAKHLNYANSPSIHAGGNVSLPRRLLETLVKRPVSRPSADWCPRDFTRIGRRVRIESRLWVNKRHCCRHSPRERENDIAAVEFTRIVITLSHIVIALVLRRGARSSSTGNNNTGNNGRAEGSRSKIFNLLKFQFTEYD